MHNIIRVFYILLYKKVVRYYKFQQYLQSILKIKHPKNIPRYYHKMNLLMLITKHQKIVPKCVLLYVIIPFVYS